MATFYQSAVAAFNKDEAGAIAVTALAKKAVKLAYSRDSLTECQNMLDLMTKNYRDALPRFFKRAGISVIDATAQAPAIIGKVQDKAQQAKVFAWLDKPETWVVNPDDVLPHAKKPAVDVKTAAEAQAKVQSMIDATIKRLKDNKQDNLLEAYQARLSAPKKVKEVVYEPGSFVTLDNKVFHLDAEEAAAVVQFLLNREVAKSGLNVMNHLGAVDASIPTLADRLNA